MAGPRAGAGFSGPARLSFRAFGQFRHEPGKWFRYASPLLAPSLSCYSRRPERGPELFRAEAQEAPDAGKDVSSVLDSKDLDAGSG